MLQYAANENFGIVDMNRYKNLLTEDIENLIIATRFMPIIQDK